MANLATERARAGRVVCVGHIHTVDHVASLVLLPAADVAAEVTRRRFDDVHHTGHWKCVVQLFHANHGLAVGQGFFHKWPPGDNRDRFPLNDGGFEGEIHLRGRVHFHVDTRLCDAAVANVPRLQRVRAGRYVQDEVPALFVRAGTHLGTYDDDVHSRQRFARSGVLDCPSNLAACGSHGPAHKNAEDKNSDRCGEPASLDRLDHVVSPP